MISVLPEQSMTGLLPHALLPGPEDSYRPRVEILVFGCLVKGRLPISQSGCLSVCLSVWQSVPVV